MSTPYKFWCPETKPSMMNHSSAHRLVLRTKNNSRKNPLYSDRYMINNKLLLFKHFINTFMSSIYHSTLSQLFLSIHTENIGKSCQPLTEIYKQDRNEKVCTKTFSSKIQAVSFSLDLIFSLKSIKTWELKRVDGTLISRAISRLTK